MIEILIISIGLVLVIEGVTFFLFIKKIKYLMTIIKESNFQTIKNISLALVIFGLCLIYFTLRNYQSLK